MRRLLAAMLLLALGAATLLTAPPASGGPGDSRTLEDLVRRLTELRLAEAREEDRWAEERTHLAGLRDLLARESAALDRKFEEVRAAADTTGAERDRLAAGIARIDDLIERLGGSVRDCAERLLAVHEALPGPLRAPLEDGAVRVRAALTTGEGPLAHLERLRLVAGFAADLDRVHRGVHAVKQVLTLGAESPREVDVLYLGAAVGYYVVPGEDRAGWVRRGRTGWVVLQNDAMTSEVRRALAVHRKEAPAELVRLPLPPEEDR